MVQEVLFTHHTKLGYFNYLPKLVQTTGIGYIHQN